MSLRVATSRMNECHDNMVKEEAHFDNTSVISTTESVNQKMLVIFSSNN